MATESQCNIAQLDAPFRRPGRDGLYFDHSVDGVSANEIEREAELPFWATSVLRQLRSNITALQLCIEPKNRELRELRSRLRLLNRVMRLQNEALTIGDQRPCGWSDCNARHCETVAHWAGRPNAPKSVRDKLDVMMADNALSRVEP